MGLLRRYWYNETSEIRFEPLEKIAHALGVKPEELLVSDEEESHAASELVPSHGMAPGIDGMSIAQGRKL